MLISEFTRALEEVVPLAAVGYERDAVGLQVGGSEGTRLRNALFVYEITSEVIAEARERDANLIVAFHPLIFPNVNAVTDRTRTGSLIRELVKSDIALYVQHTAFDTQMEFGTSQLMADVLELDDIRPLVPLKNSLDKITVFAPYASSKPIMESLIQSGAGRIGNSEGCSFQVEGRGQFKSQRIASAEGEPAVLEGVDEVRLEMVCERWNTARAIRAMLETHPHENVTYDVTPLATESRNYGMGAIGRFEEVRSREEVLQLTSAAFSIPSLRYNAGGPETILNIAMVGGAGMEFYSAARALGADAFITADIRYHDFHWADHEGILLIDAGHAETERFVTHGMIRAARKALLQFSASHAMPPAFSDEHLLVARTEPNSVRYYHSGE
jgi:dinuclear metal center YbgI/SA1388 family protein